MHVACDSDNKNLVENVYTNVINIQESPFWKGGCKGLGGTDMYLGELLFQTSRKQLTIRIYETLKWYETIKLEGTPLSIVIFHIYYIGNIYYTMH